MSQPTYPAYIPGRTPPKRRLHPTVWAALGAVVALAVAGGVYLAIRPTASVDLSGQVVALCEDAARNEIKSPASAQFSSVQISGADPAWTVYGDMDAQNGFGAMLRTHFRCTVARGSGGDLFVTSHSVDEPS